MKKIYIIFTSYRKSAYTFRCFQKNRGWGWGVLNIFVDDIHLATVVR